MGGAGKRPDGRADSPQEPPRRDSYTPSAVPPVGGVYEKSGGGSDGGSGFTGGGWPELAQTVAVISRDGSGRYLWTQHPSVMDAGLYYQEHGLALLPLNPGQKTPAAHVIRGVYGDRSASWKPLAARRATKGEIREWFEADPDINLGIFCGTPSNGLVVADFDAGPCPVALPPTPTATTGRGEHVYLHSTALDRTLKLPQGDLKATGYVVAPPSLHPSGSRYEWRIPFGQVALVELDSLPFAPTDLSLGEGQGQDQNLGEISPLGSAPLAQVVGARQEESLERGLAAWTNCEPFVAKLAALCGWRLRGSFDCTIHGDSKTRSAALYRTDSGRWVYKCFHRDGQTWSLAQAFAATITAQEGWDMPLATHTVWTLRALAQTGFLNPPNVPMPVLPPSASDDAHLLWEKVRLLFAVKWSWWPWTGDPTTLARSFMVPWSGLPQHRFEAAKGELLRHRVIEKAGSDGRTSLYLPGGFR